MTIPITVRRYAPLAACAAVLVWHSLQYNFVTDDAFISFVYSRNLAEHGTLAFNVGAPVEGFTNFLWTVLLGLLMVVGLQPEITSLVLGTAFAIGTMVVTARLVQWLWERPSEWDSLPAALLGLTAGYACWSSGGLETQMFTFWVALGLYAYVRGDSDGQGRWLRRAGVFFALSAMTRPEGLLVTAVVGGHRLAHMLIRDRRLRPTRDELYCAAWFLGLWGPYFAWRWWYYGYPFPNTYYVKAAGETSAKYDQELRSRGWYYLWQWARQTRVLWVAPLIAVGAFAARLRSRRFYYGSLAVPLGLLYLGYVVRVGGDFMGLHRFVMPVFLLAAVLAAIGLRWVVEQLPGLSAQRWGGLAAVAVLLGLHGYHQLALTARQSDPENLRSDKGIDTPAYLAVYAHDRELIGRHMASCMSEQDFSIFGGVGAKPYYGHMRGIDVFGLVSDRIAHEVKPTVARPGHNKWAPNHMLLEMEPTFIFSCYSLHQRPNNPGFNCNPSYWERNGYERVTLYIPGMVERGEYYTFFARKDRHFECPGKL